MIPVDPITIGVIHNNLLTIVDEMAVTLRSTAYSAAVTEAMDFSTAITDSKGRLVAQGDTSPGHLGAMPFVVKHVLRAFPPEKLNPGDAVLLNDPALGSGHMPDFYLVSPIFWGGKPFAFAVNSAHQVDIGGAAPGSQAVEGIMDLYQEGIRILPVRIYKAGEEDADLFKIIAGNVRLPEEVIGDMKAQRNANRVGETRILELINRYGAEVVEEAVEAILRRTEMAMRSAIREIPNGKYSFTDYIDDTGRGTDPIKVRVTVEVRDEDIIIDFTGSSQQRKTGMNSYLTFTRSYIYHAVKAFTLPEAPQNDGGLRPIEVLAPEGSFFNCTYPYGSGARAIIANRIEDAFIGAIGQAIPNKALGAFSQWANPNIHGINPVTESPFIWYGAIYAGFGARAHEDGPEALCSYFNATNIPIEIQETNSSLIIERFELITDSGGPGKYRGGLGIQMDVRINAREPILSNLCDRQKFGPFGVYGGKPGALGATLLRRGTKVQAIHSKEILTLEFGDVISFRVAGAGGYGNPLEREPEAVRLDVIKGYVSKEGATRDYGVVINTNNELDMNETNKLRDRLLNEQCRNDEAKLK